MAELTEWCVMCMEELPLSEIKGDTCKSCYEKVTNKNFDDLEGPKVNEAGTLEFDSMDDLLAFSKKNKAPKKPPPVVIFKEVHFFIRPNDTWNQVMKDAREERKFSNVNVKIFAHNHLHGEKCKDCKEY